MAFTESILVREKAVDVRTPYCRKENSLLKDDFFIFLFHSQFCFQTFTPFAMFDDLLCCRFECFIQPLNLLLLCLQTELMMWRLFERDVRCCILLQNGVETVDRLVKDLSPMKKAQWLDIGCLFVLFAYKLKLQRFSKLSGMVSNTYNFVV